MEMAQKFTKGNEQAVLSTPKAILKSNTIKVNAPKLLSGRR